MKFSNKQKLAYAVSFLGLILFLVFVSMVNSVKAGKFFYGEVVGIQDNLITIKLEDFPDFEVGRRIEINPDVNIGNNPDPVVTPTAIGECEIDCD